MKKDEIQYSYFGILFVVAVLLYWYVGKLIDGYLQTSFFQIIGVLLGILSVGIKLVYMVKSGSRDRENKK